MKKGIKSSFAKRVAAVALGTTMAMSTAAYASIPTKIFLTDGNGVVREYDLSMLGSNPSMKLSFQEALKNSIASGGAIKVAELSGGALSYVNYVTGPTADPYATQKNDATHISTIAPTPDYVVDASGTDISSSVAVTVTNVTAVNATTLTVTLSSTAAISSFVLKTAAGVTTGGTITATATSSTTYSLALGSAIADGNYTIGATLDSGAAIPALAFTVDAGTVPTTTAVLGAEPAKFAGWVMGTSINTFTVSLSSGTATSWAATGLPTGVSIAAATGIISGTPATSGTFNVTIKALNAAGGVVASTAVISVAVAAGTNVSYATTVVTASAAGVVLTPTVTGVTLSTAATWSFTGTTVPGLEINTTNGAITCTITTPASYTVNVKVVDGTFTTTATVAFSVIAEAPTQLVTHASDVNATIKTLTLTFAEPVTETELLNKQISLTNSTYTLTAKYVPASLSGKVATFVVDQPIISNTQYNGNYTVSADWIAIAAGLKTTYTATISETNVKGFVTEFGDPVEGVVVTVDGNTGTTDEDGYYIVPASAGKTDVSFQMGGADAGKYFVNTVEAKVLRNFSTVVNTSLTAIDATLFTIDGTVINSKDSTVVTDAAVTLQQFVDGVWEDLGDSILTDENGKYTFANSEAVDSDGDPIVDTDYAIIFEDDLITNAPGTLRVVINKDLSSTNFTSVFKEEIVPVELSKVGHHTAILTPMTIIPELKELKLSIDWQNLDGTANDAVFTTTSASFTLLDTTGQKELVSKIPFEAIKLEKAEKLTTPLDLVAGFGGTGFFKEGVSTVVPRIPTGTYFLTVDDGINAIAIIPVFITQGVNNPTSGMIEKAHTLQTTTKYGSFTYANTLADGLQNNEDRLLVSAMDAQGMPALGTTSVAAFFVASKTVNVQGVSIDVKVVESKVEEKPEYFTIKKDPDGKITSVDIGKGITQLGLGQYKIKVGSDYIFDGSVNLTTQLTNKDINTADLIAQTASTLELTVLNASSGDSAITGASVTLVMTAANGSEISYAEDTDATDGKVKFKGIAPGEYSAKVSVKGYEVGTIPAFTVYDIMDKTATVKLKANEAARPTLSGYVRFDKTHDVVTKASIMVYTEAGVPVTYFDVTDGSYSLSTANNLKAGTTYKLVLRGEKIENAVETVTLNETGITQVNFNAVLGGEAKASYNVFDTNSRVLTGIKAFTATDSFYAKTGTGFKIGVDNTTIKSGKPDFDGSFDFVQTPKDIGKVWATGTSLAAGTYKVFISDNKDKYVDTDDIEFKVDRNKNYDGPNTYIQLRSSTGTITYTISGTVNKQTEVDYVVAFNKDGKIVDMTSDIDDGNFELTVANGSTYSVSYFANGCYQTSKEIPVQDFDIKGVSLNADFADR